MRKYNTRTKQEKEQLLKEFHSSGMSITKWCSKQNIQCSTFSKWLSKEKANNAFVPLSIKCTPSKTGTATLNKDVIKLHIKGITVDVYSDTSSKLLEDVLKVVLAVDV